MEGYTKLFSRQAVLMFVISALISGCSQNSTDSVAEDIENQVVEDIADQKAVQDIGDLLPTEITGVPGIPIEIFFRNMGSDISDDEFFITPVECTCAFGRTERRRWIGTPTKNDIGTHDLTIELKNSVNGETYSFSSRLTIVEESTKVKDLRLLIVGDSITRQQHYPNRLVKLLKSRLNLSVSTFGKVSLQKDEYDIRYFQPADPDVAVEAYNGWTTGMFLNDFWLDSSISNPESDVSRSPFWYGDSLENGELDFVRYVNEVGDGKFPDIVIIMLGTNDVASADVRDPERPLYGIESLGALVSNNIRRMVDLFRSDGVNRPVVVVTPPPSSVSKAAVLNKYGTSVGPNKARDFNLATLLLGKRLFDDFVSESSDEVYIVPNYIGFDPIDGYMQEEVVHPITYGHEQIANQVYAKVTEMLHKDELVQIIHNNRK